MLFTKNQEVRGFQTQTFYIELLTNQLSYPLSNQRNLGIPDNATIYGFFTRMSGVSYLNKPLQGTASEKAFLSLKNSDSNAILNNIPWYRFDPFYADTTYFGYTNPFIEPHLNSNMDWIGSNVQFAKGTTITTGDVLEFTVYYTVPNLVQATNGGVSTYYSNNSVPNLRQTLITIETKNAQTEYNLSKSRNIGINDEDIVVGMSLLQNGTDLLGNKCVGLAAINASFLTLKMQSYVVMNRAPINFRMSYFWGLPYFPILPYPAAEFDWQNSTINCANAALMTNNEAFIIQLHYIKQPQ